MICAPPPEPAAHDWRRSMVARAIRRAFTPPPDMEIWEWADENVMLQNEDAAEPGEYRSSKTPWTRRIQELMRRPFVWTWSFEQQRWQRVKVSEVNVQKSSQSGFSEACLNGIRWRAVFRPCNTIYAIDSADEAKKIARRLLRSFKFLDQSIYTGDPDDIKTTEFALRGMELLFYGSFSPGKFANKQAPFCIADEVEEHGSTAGDTSTTRNLASRKKTSTGGLQINLSKPKLKGGPINVLFLRGNQEEFFVPCPHCQLLQPLTWTSEERDIPFSEMIDEICDESTGEVVARLPRPLPLGERRQFRTGRMVFDHCKNLLGRWDRLRVLNETYYECAGCQGKIEEGAKRWMIDRGEWRPMEVDCSPGIVSQQMNDLFSEDELSKWGVIALEYIDAKHEGREALQGWMNQRLGKVWSEKANATEPADVLANIAGKTLWFIDAPNSEGQPVRHIFQDEASAERLSAQHAARGCDAPVLRSACPPYRRGTSPFAPYRSRADQPATLLAGSDVGGNYAKWAVVAVHKNMVDVAVIDWGTELDPDDVARVMMTRRWSLADASEQCRVIYAFMDARYRTRDVYRAALGSKGVVIPCMGLGGATAQTVRLWNYTRVPEFHRDFRRLDYNKQRSLDATYTDRLHRKRKRLWFPVDVEDDPDFVAEMCGEEQEEDRRGRMVWMDPAPRPNHFGDCIAQCVLGLDYLTARLRGQEGG